MHTYTPQSRTRFRKAAGFSLMEVLVSMGILTLGMVAVASLFPTAILLQKETVNDTLRQQNVRSAEALLQAKTVDATILFNFTEDSGNNAKTSRAGVRDLEFDVYALAEVDLDGNASTGTDPDMSTPSYGVASNYTAAGSYLANWPAVDRSFPSIISNPAQREIYTVPLFRRGPEGTDYINDWVVYLFVMERNTDASGLGYYTNDPTLVPDVNTGTGNITHCANPFDDANYFPKVFRMEVTKVKGNRMGLGLSGNHENFPDGSSGWRIRIGDMILADNGNIYRVSDAYTAGAGDPDFSQDHDIIVVNQDLRQDTEGYLESGKKIQAVWFAMPPTNNAGSPVRDIRILSASTVSVETSLAP